MGRGSGDHRALFVPINLGGWLPGTGLDQKNTSRECSVSSMYIIHKGVKIKACGCIQYKVNIYCIHRQISLTRKFGEKYGREN